MGGGYAEGAAMPEGINRADLVALCERLHRLTMSLPQEPGQGASTAGLTSHPV
jgi:hypothetical protein